MRVRTKGALDIYKKLPNALIAHLRFLPIQWLGIIARNLSQIHILWANSVQAELSLDYFDEVFKKDFT